MTDIMRLEPSSKENGFYALAFLTTATGQTLIRRDPAGSVINHLAPDDLAGIPVPLLGKEIRDEIIEGVQQAVELGEAATNKLLQVDADLRERLGLGDAAPVTWPATVGQPRISTRSTDELASRFDAEFFSDRSERARQRLIGGDHDRLDAMADLVILGRYKRYYVEPPHGTPILSSGQLHQLRPVALKHISDRSFSAPADYRLIKGWSLIACDGRAEGDLGRPGFVSSLMHGWMASNHLMRVVPKAAVHPGYLHAALRVQEVQVQLKSVATGSVVDALDDTTCSPAILPRVGEDEAELGSRVEEAYENWAEAYRRQSEAADLFEAELQRAYEKHSVSAAADLRLRGAGAPA